MTRLFPVGMLCACLLTGTALAEVPPYMPVQGVLLDPQGVPLEGTFSLVISLYGSEDAVAALWSNQHDVDVQRGLFTVRAGPLDLALFESAGELWLGIQVEQDPEMNRIALGAVPWAGFAQHAPGPAVDGLTITWDAQNRLQVQDIPDGVVTRDKVAENTLTMDRFRRFDSGWQPVNAQAEPIVFTHDLGVPPTVMQCYLAENQDGSGARASCNGPVNVEVDFLWDLPNLSIYHVYHHLGAGICRVDATTLTLCPGRDGLAFTPHSDGGDQLWQPSQAFVRIIAIP